MKKYKYFVLLNSSVRGPYLPVYVPVRPWAVRCLDLAVSMTAACKQASCRVLAQMQCLCVCSPCPSMCQCGPHTPVQERARLWQTLAASYLCWHATSLQGVSTHAGSLCSRLLTMQAEVAWHKLLTAHKRRVSVLTSAHHAGQGGLAQAADGATGRHRQAGGASGQLRGDALQGQRGQHVEDKSPRAVVHAGYGQGALCLWSWLSD